jgi:hypothetical protein
MPPDFAPNHSFWGVHVLPVIAGHLSMVQLTSKTLEALQLDSSISHLDSTV